MHDHINNVAGYTLLGDKYPMHGDTVGMETWQLLKVTKNHVRLQFKKERFIRDIY